MSKITDSLKILKKDKKNLTLFSIFILFAVLFETVGVALVIPLFKIIMTDQEFINFNFSIFNKNFYFEFLQFKLLIFAMSFVVFFYFIKTAYLVFFNYWKSKFIFDQNKKISLRLFKSYIFKPYLFHIQTNTSLLVRNLNGVQNYVRNFDQIMGLLTEMVIALFLFVILFLYQPKLSLILILIIFIFVLTYYFTINKISLRIGKESYNSNQKIFQSINQGLFAIKEIKLYGREKDFLKIFSKNIETYSDAYKIYETIQPLPKILLELVGVIIIISSIGILYYLGVSSDEIIILVALIAAISFRIVPSFNRALIAVQHLKFYLPLANTIQKDLLNFEESKIIKRGKNIIFEKKIEIKNLVFNYPEKDMKVINDLNLEINKFDTIGIHGSSGAGKTTLINILLGLLSPSKNSTYVDNKLVEFSDRAWQDKIGYVAQNVYLIDDTIKRNIAFGIDDDHIDINRLNTSIKLAQLSDYIETLDDKLDSKVGENGINLSGGQIQRIGIARALYNNPEIIILDEPSSALDENTENKILSEISNIKSNKTIIIISHKKSTLSICNKIFNFKNGKVSLERLN
tara:strand:- start:74 stop:1792 length:1719 start_codon:yes stop_codon:yes gene_type:complete